MPISIVRLGAPRLPGEGLRLGTVRRPPRGVRKADFAKRDFYDTWLPALSPSQPLVTAALAAQAAADAKAWKKFARAFAAEMTERDAAHLLDLLAALSHQTSFAIGCYCADERWCHRSILRELLQQRGARLTAPRAGPA